MISPVSFLLSGLCQESGTPGSIQHGAFPLQVCGVSSKQQQSLLQMHFQGLHLFTGMVYDFAQGCQVPSGNQEICLVLGSELWGILVSGVGKVDVSMDLA